MREACTPKLASAGLACAHALLYARPISRVDPHARDGACMLCVCVRAHTHVSDPPHSDICTNPHHDAAAIALAESSCIPHAERVVLCNIETDARAQGG